VPVPSVRRAQARTALALFAALGAQVGAFAVLVPDLAASRGLTPAALGAALAVMSAASIATLFLAGPLADRYGRRPLLIAGTGGFAASFALLAGVEAQAAVWPTLALYGVASGCLDLGANAVGADYEREHGVRAMVRLHAGFSGAAAAFALLASLVAAQAGHEVAYAAMAAAYAVLAAAVGRAPLPEYREPPSEARDEALVAGAGEAPREALVVGAGEALVVGAAEPAGPPLAAGRLALLRVPGIAIATAICTLCFFGDGAIEGFAALLLRGAQGAGTLGAGLSLAAFHAASLAGRLWFARIGDARGDAFVVTAAGVSAAAAMTVLVTAGSPVIGGLALLVVGFALAPVIPTVLSLAGRSAPGRSGAAVSLVTTVGYSAFVLGPPVVGVLAGLTSLRAAMSLAIGTMLAFAALGRRVREPGSTDHRG
jgi:MFS family permease